MKIIDKDPKTGETVFRFQASLEVRFAPTVKGTATLARRLRQLDPDSLKELSDVAWSEVFNPKLLDYVEHLSTVVLELDEVIPITVSFHFDDESGVITC